MAQFVEESIGPPRAFTVASDGAIEESAIARPGKIGKTTTGWAAGHGLISPHLT